MAKEDGEQPREGSKRGAGDYLKKPKGVQRDFEKIYECA